MSAQLSKLHVRFIQSQKQFSLTQNSTKTKLPITQLYIKDKNHFYLINYKDTITESDTVQLDFSESDTTLSALSCKADVAIMDAKSSAYDEALLFFQTGDKPVAQLLYLTIVSMD